MTAGYPLNERGASLVEAVIVLPVVAFLLFGLIQYALIFATEAYLRAAAATGARMVSLSNPPSSNLQLETAVRTAANTWLDPARLNVAIVVNQIDNTKRINATYNLPLMLPFLVPNSVGGTLTLISQATGKCNGICTLF